MWVCEQLTADISGIMQALQHFFVSATSGCLLHTPVHMFVDVLLCFLLPRFAFCLQMDEPAAALTAQA